MWGGWAKKERSGDLTRTLHAALWSGPSRGNKTAQVASLLAWEGVSSPVPPTAADISSKFFTVLPSASGEAFPWVPGSQAPGRILKRALSPSHTRHSTLVGSLPPDGLAPGCTGRRDGMKRLPWTWHLVLLARWILTETQCPLETLGRTGLVGPFWRSTLIFSCCAPAGWGVSGHNLPCQVINDLHRNTYRYEWDLLFKGTLKWIVSWFILVLTIYFCIYWACFCFFFFFSYFEAFSFFLI